MKPRKEYKPKTQDEIRQEISDRVVEAIEKNGKLPWQPGFMSDKAFARQYNMATDNAYHGVNQLLLMCSDYQSNVWIGFKQMVAIQEEQAKQGLSREQCMRFKGENRTGTSILVRMPKTITVEEKNPKTGLVEETEKQIFLYKTTSIFNSDQFENIPEKYLKRLVTPQKVRENQIEDLEVVFKIESGMRDLGGVTIIEAGQQPCYRPSTHTVEIPPRNLYKSEYDRAADLLHELGHATANEKILPRKTHGLRENKASYAREELRVEYASMLIGLETGICPGQAHFDNHAAYLQSWLQVIKEEPKALFEAIKQGTEIADKLMDMGLQWEQQHEASQSQHQAPKPSAEPVPENKRQVALSM